jgi:hypothetical protein
MTRFVIPPRLRQLSLERNPTMSFLTEFKKTHNSEYLILAELFLNPEKEYRDLLKDLLKYNLEREAVCKKIMNR